VIAHSKTIRSTACEFEGGRAALGLYGCLNAGLAKKTRELFRSTRVQSIASRQTGIVVTTKNADQNEPAMIPESIMLRCIANCLETSRYYASRGNRPLADWWHDRAKGFAQRLATDS
jgi:hypothetical protein